MVDGLGNQRVIACHHGDEHGDDAGQCCAVDVDGSGPVHAGHLEHNRNIIKEKSHNRVKASPFVFPGFIPGTQVSTSAKPEAWVAGMNPAMTLKGIALQVAYAPDLIRGPAKQG
jgi:hypothetical protein